MNELMVNTVYEVTLVGHKAPQVTVRSNNHNGVKAGIAWARQTGMALEALA